MSFFAYGLTIMPVVLICIVLGIMYGIYLGRKL